MRALCKWPVWMALLWAAGLQAQEPEPDAALGYLRFVNATGYDGVLKVSLDGVDINPKGYVAGQATGAVGLPPKTCQIEMKHDILGELKTSVILKPGMVSAVVALPLVEKEPKPGEKPKVELTSQVIESPPSTRGRPPTVTILQTTPMETMELKVGSLSCAAARMKPETVTLTGFAEFTPVTLGDKKLATLNFTDPADQVLVFFTNEQGLVKQVSFNNQVK